MRQYYIIERAHICTFIMCPWTKYLIAWIYFSSLVRCQSEHISHRAVEDKIRQSSKVSKQWQSFYWLWNSWIYLLGILTYVNSISILSLCVYICVCVCVYTHTYCLIKYGFGQCEIWNNWKSTWFGIRKLVTESWLIVTGCLKCVWLRKLMQDPFLLPGLFNCILYQGQS